MDSLDGFEKTFIEDVIGIELSKQSIDEVKKFLEEKCQYYIHENTKMETGLKKLGLLKQDQPLEVQMAIEKLSTLQISFDAKDCTVESILLSKTEKLRNPEEKYLNKIKMCMKMLYSLNEKLMLDIQQEERNLNTCKLKLVSTCNVSKNDTEVLEAKIKMHQKELQKFEERYPWLCDSQLHLLKISKEMETLMQLKQKRLELLESLDIYEGLKPDLNEAKQQLRELKEQHREFTENIVKGRVE